MGNRIDRRFDFLRQKAEQGARQREDETSAALERRGVQQGIAGGAQAKLQERAQKQNAELRANEVGDIESQREAALAQQDELEANRRFSREERLGSQEFASGEARLGREFAAGEAEKGRQQELMMTNKNQLFQRRLFDQEMGFKQRAQKASESQFGQQMKLALKQFGLDEEVSKFNMYMAKRMANKKDLFGGIGSWLEKGRKGGGGLSGRLSGAAMGGAVAGPAGAITGGVGGS